MSLVLIAVAPDGIVIGADSAMTNRTRGEELALTNFPKIVPLRGTNEAMTIIGDARIGPPERDSWIHSWLRTFAENVASNKSLSQLARELVNVLNEESLPYDGHHVVNLVGWVRSQEIPEPFPRVIEVSRSPSNPDEYANHYLLTDSFVNDIVKWRQGSREKGYLIMFLSAGIPQNYAQWIVKEGRNQHSSLIGSAVPQPDITSVAEYVRFLIRAVAELHRIARRPAYVGEPVETLILFPQGITKVSMRY